jgi:hypothetical protein
VDCGVVCAVVDCVVVDCGVAVVVLLLLGVVGVRCTVVGRRRRVVEGGAWVCFGFVSGASFLAQ